jgi:hypothetical protein
MNNGAYFQALRDYITAHRESLLREMQAEPAEQRRA